MIFMDPDQLLKKLYFCDILEGVFYMRLKVVTKQLKQVKFTNCSQFLSHNFFGLDFHFYVIFLLIGIGHLDNDV